METVSLSIIFLRSNEESAQATNQTYLNIKPDFQREYEAWNNKLKTRLIESILLNRAMNPIWVIRNDEDESEEVLDGMHRLTTALKFINNEFSLDGNFIDDERYKNKFFKDLSSDDKGRIRSYNFIINKLDSSYRTDPEKLQDMYELLNRSSKTLNEYEFSKPLFKPFHDIISRMSKLFFNTVVYEHDTSSRGRIETEIIKMLALCEDRLPDSFSSINDIYMRWQKDNIGENKVSIDEAVAKNGERYVETLTLVKKVIDKFTEDGLFDFSKESKRRNAVPCMIIITRTVAILKQVALFNRHAANIITTMKQEIFTTDIQQKLECNGNRNAKFQKKLIAFVDHLLKTEIGAADEPRFFAKRVIEEKLKEQEQKCALCRELINPTQKFDGDHITAWVNGGRTIKENLQVVHQKCHKRMKI